MIVLSTAGVTRQCVRFRRTLTQATVASASKPRVVVVTGPTAVGKSAIGVELARRLNGEIISADSVQVYRGLDVGSDKVSAETRQEVPHHLIDIFPPTVDFNAGHFYNLGREAIDDILQRGKTPIVVGGTGFYLKWLVEGRPSTPPSSPGLEQKMQRRIEKAWAAAEAAAGGQELSKTARWEVAVQLLVEDGDPETAERVRKEPHNYYRLRRAMQILAQSPGQKLADLDVQPSEAPYDFRCFFLSRPRIPLWRRIMDRCELMVEGGLLQEAVLLEEEMVAAGVTQCQAGKAIGYSQALDFLKKVRAQQSVAEEDVQQLAQEVAAGTRALVRSQLTWFRKERAYRWIDIALGQSNDDIVEAVLQYLELPEHEGGGGKERVLSKEESQALKRHLHCLSRLQEQQQVAPVVAWVQQHVLLRQPSAVAG